MLMVLRTERQRAAQVELGQCAGAVSRGATLLAVSRARRVESLGFTGVTTVHIYPNIRPHSRRGSRHTSAVRSTLLRQFRGCT